jgi:hypothetical protein
VTGPDDVSDAVDVVVESGIDDVDSATMLCSPRMPLSLGII